MYHSRRLICMDGFCNCSAFVIDMFDRSLCRSRPPRPGPRDRALGPFVHRLRTGIAPELGSGPLRSPWPHLRLGSPWESLVDRSTGRNEAAYPVWLLVPPHDAHSAR
jgi:hypothetical protein